MSLSKFSLFINISSPLKWKEITLSVPGLPPIDGLSRTEPEGIPAIARDLNNTICIAYTSEYKEEVEEKEVIKYQIEFIYSRDLGKTWKAPIVVVKDIDLCQPSIFIDKTNTIFIFYWKGDKIYQCYSRNYKDFQGFTEVKGE